MRVRLAVLLLMTTTLVSQAISAQSYQCDPTLPDEAGPFYLPNAPVRSQIGNEYLLFGEVKSAANCQSVCEARIEIWMTGPNGRYDDHWRATVFTRCDGRYFFTSHFPAPYGSRPPHIHLRVTAPGFQELFTQHYPVQGSGEALLNLVLKPSH